MPFLFQRQRGTAHDVLASRTIAGMLRRSCYEIAQTNPVFADTKFSPHDFRRLFATDIVNGGLPIHVGAALLGHLNLQTTQGYVAVFAEDIVQLPGVPEPPPKPAPGGRILRCRARGVGRSSRRCCPGSRRSKETWSCAANAPRKNSGSARSKAST
ncbi:tyrosine-type recombinase/integrase [Streptomyces sp. NPDC088762]|uniref:tyrosine-type recombinase/integrase n=1 Tax=Streptomyces sp. NPDC088762 TaxID=3365891 RepID=UPI0037F342BA